MKELDTNVKENSKEYYVIDVKHILKTLFKKAWIVAIVGVIAAMFGFLISACVTPTYSSSVMLYVNNTSSSQNNPNFSISSSEITAAQSLVRTYSEILKNRYTLERIIDRTGVPYNYKQLSAMIEAAPANNTEIMRVTVTSEDPYEAARIAKAISEVLPERVDDIIEGAEMKPIEKEINPNFEKVAPGTAKYMIFGLLIGIFGSAAVIVVFAMLDDTIHDEEYVLQNYNYPVLAKIPNLVDTGTKRYGYYYQSKKTEAKE